MPLHRPCSKCGTRFLPTGKASKICESCKRKILLANSRKASTKARLLRRNK